MAKKKGKKLKKRIVRRRQKKALTKQVIARHVKREHVEGRKIPIKLAATLYAILGVISVLSGLLMLSISYIANGNIIAFSSAIISGQLALFIIGITSISLGITEFLVGYGLWRFHKWAGTLGLVMAGVSSVLSVPYATLNIFSGLLSLVMSLILIVLIYLGRNELLESGF